jgi:RHS repeat-associated protein
MLARLMILWVFLVWPLEFASGAGVFYHADGIGSTKALSDQNGNLLDSYQYDAYGAVENHTGTTANAYRYTGEYFDDSISLQYNRARWYAPTIGRFTALDTYLGADYSPATQNHYVYGDSNPIGNIDPSGNFSLGEVMTTINTSLNLASQAVSIYQDIFGDPENVTIDGIPSIWDYLMSFALHTVAASFATSSIPTGPGGGGGGLPPPGRPEQHHVIPVYTCGHKDQRLSTLSVLDHRVLHNQLNNFKFAIDIAGFAIDLLVYKRPTSRITKTPLQRLGAKSVGRGAIAAGLAFFYSKEDWIWKGSPSIGLTLALETPRFIGTHHSAPACQR